MRTDKEYSIKGGILMDWWNDWIDRWGCNAAEFLLFSYGLGMYHLPGSGRDRSE